MIPLENNGTMTDINGNNNKKPAIKRTTKEVVAHMRELHKQHQGKLEDITCRFDSIKLTLSEKVESLRNECDRLRDRARLCEDALQRDSDFKVQCALAPYKNLPEEIESLKTVVEMRNGEILKLRSHNQELRKKLEELPIAQEKIIALQQKKENLEAIISMKTDHERTLHGKCQNLMKKYDKESRANKRLSMDYEELMWKLSESFSETDMGSQEALFYKKMGMSPPGADFMGSPEASRKLRTPSGSEINSPSRSPGYRRTVSSGGSEDKKLKRRSGAHLLDEKKQRSTSPLASDQNPLTKSWSPSTEPASPARANQQVTKQMSQSWSEADVFESPDDRALSSVSSESEYSQSSQCRVLDSRSLSENDESLLSAISDLDSEKSQNALNRKGKINGISGEEKLTIVEVDNSPSSESGSKHIVSLTDDEIVVFRHKKDCSPVSPQHNGRELELDLSSSIDSMDLDSLQTETPLLETQQPTSPPTGIPKDSVTISSHSASGSRSPEHVDSHRSRTQAKAIPTCSKRESAV